MNYNRPYNRLDRINNQIRSIISKTIIKNSLFYEFCLLTISRVDVSPDLKKAKIYFSVYNSTKKISDINILINKKRKYFRKILGSKMRTKNTPDLFFFYDDSIEYEQKLFKELNKLKNK